MNPGPLWKPVLLLCATATIALPQNRPSPAPGVPLQAPQSQAAAAQLPPAPAQVEPSPTPTPVPLPQDANQYVRQALDHELAEQARDHSHWRYHHHREDEKNNYDRDVIETSEGSLARTLLLWGRPLTSAEREQDEARMRRLVSDPAERAKRLKREKEDDEKVMKMLRAIPQAFTFKYDGEENGLVRLSFVPAPHYDPPSLELRIFRSLKGHLFVDRAQTRLAGIDGSLFEDVSFGFGILGRLYKGGTFRVVRKEIGEGHWEVVSEEVNMIGRAVLFKTITRKQREILTDFHHMPDSITMSQAFEMLHNDSGPVSVSSSHAALQPQGKQ